MLEEQVIIKELGSQNTPNISSRKKKNSYSTFDIVVEQSYFDLAMEWYINKYLSPFGMLFYTIIFFIILSFVSYNVYRTTTSYYAVERVPFATYFDDTVEYFAKIKPIVEQKHEKISVSLARYMIKEYVLLRENYSRDILQVTNWNELLEKIRHLSSRKVYTEYMHHMNIYENPESPILKYRFFEKCSAQVVKVKFVIENDEEVPSSAIVFFNLVTSVKEKVVNSEKKKAIIYFNINDVLVKNAEMSDPLYFIVTYYKVEDVA